MYNFYASLSDLELPDILEEYSVETFLQELPFFLHPDSPYSNLSALAKLALEGILQDKFRFESSDKIV